MFLLIYRTVNDNYLYNNYFVHYHTMEKVVYQMTDSHLESETGLRVNLRRNAFIKYV
jgi:hypothetical protein